MPDDAPLGGALPPAPPPGPIADAEDKRADSAGDHQLGADAIRASDQDRIRIACRLEIEHGTETAKVRYHAAAIRGFGCRSNGGN